MKKILVIDTDVVLSNSLKTFLEANSYEVSVTPNLQAVDKLILQNEVDVMIYNKSNPKLNGSSSLLNLRSRQSTNNFPIILISDSGKEDGYEFKHFDHIETPLNYHRLLKTIERSLAKKNAEKSRDTKDITITSLSELKAHIFKTEERCFISKGQTIYKQYKNATCVYLIEEGLIKTFRMDEYGKELITGLYKDEDLFGFYSFKNISMYPETAKALKNCTIYKFSIKSFQKILGRHNGIALEFAQILSDNVSSLKMHMLDLAYASVLKKTTNTLLHFAEHVLKSPTDSINLSRSDLASVAGISTESLIRSLTQLKQNNLIEVNGRNIKVLDLKKLHYIK